MMGIGIQMAIGVAVALVLLLTAITYSCSSRRSQQSGQPGNSNSKKSNEKR